MHYGLILEMIGTIAFASSGAMTGIKKNMDIFGIIVLAVVTALGGGIIRDVILGNTPPKMFSNYSYTLVAITTADVLFLLFRCNSHLLSGRFIPVYESVMNIADAVGLGIFTVSGIATAQNLGYDGTFLLIFVGMLTGIGGGICRDVLAKEIPYIFVKQIYASASLIGAVVYLIVLNWLTNIPASVISVTTTLIIRLLATHYRWDLPKVR